MKNRKLQTPIALLVFGLIFITTPLVKADKKHSRNINVNRNVKVNKNKKVNRNVNVKVNKSVRVNDNYSRRVDVNYHNRNHWGSAVRTAAGVAAGIAIGKAITAPPAGYRTVYHGNVPYAYHNGDYYQPAPSGGYVVAPPPIGVVVPVLPTGAALTVVNGLNVYRYGDIYYQPVFVNGVTAYQTVRF